MGAPHDIAPEVLVEFLGSTRAFASTDAATLAKVAPHIQAVPFVSGSTILKAGAPASFIGIVYAGRASARLVNAMTGERTARQDLRIGDHFGEIAILLESAQPLEVAAEADTVVLVLAEKVVKWLLAKAANFPLALAKTLAGRLVRLGLATVGARASLRPDGDSVPPPSYRPPPSSMRPQALPSDAPPLAVAELGREGSTVPFLRTSAFDINEQLLGIVPVESMLQHRFLPLALDGNVLTVGMVDPHHHAAVNEIDRVLHGIELRVAAIGHDDYMATLARLQLDAGRRRNPAQLAAEPIVYERGDAEREEQTLNVIGKEVVGLLDKIFVAAVGQGASDIHIEEQKAGLRVRFRVNGQLRDSGEYIPVSFARGVVARVKILAGLDITERRRPQDGRIGMRIGRRDVDFRVSTLPTGGRGEKIVMRMFEAANMLRPLEQIFLDQATLHITREALGRPYGAIIVAGATGSGKSSTLYACLHERKTNRPDTNICVVEDPIEYRLEGVTQVQVNYAVELTFAKVLRAFLRQDPDVVVVGEMRDAETAMIGLEAAMTGHLVFSSFHANNVSAAIQRLENLGCNRTMIAQAVALVLIQRLVRRLCPHCVRLTDTPRVLAKSLADRGLVEGTGGQVPKAPGCDRCEHTGYAGRVAVIESLRINDAVAAMLMAGERLDEIEKHAHKSGLLVPFRRYAAMLMARKIISPGDALLAVAG